MGKPCTIDSFFKRKSVENSKDDTPLPIPDVETLKTKSRPPKSPRIESEKVDTNYLERDPGLRQQIWEYPIEQRDEIRRAYIRAGPYQFELIEYPKSGSTSHPRRFQASWFKLYSWLEYSPTKDAAFCLQCFLFNKPGGHYGQSTFTVEGFRNWKKVREGKNCAFLNHEGKDPNSLHKLSESACQDLMNQSQHIQQVLGKHTSQQIVANRLRLKASIDAVRWLAFQGCAFRGHDESKDSINRGNYLELLKLLASYDEKVAEVVLHNAPKNASYTSADTQKEILYVLADKVQRAIREDIGDAKFCIIVDEARDESKKEQMAIVLRYVDKDGFVRERFFGLVHVRDTTSLTLKNAIFSILSSHNLDYRNIRGQGYDGASNMRGEWNGLQALIANESPCAYYIHCLAHRLQLALVAASREVIPIHQFFSKLNFIVNIVGASCKRNDELKIAQADDVARMIALDEIETGTGLNQIGTLQRAGDTRWSSHLKSISSLIKMFNATCVVLNNIIDEGTTPSQRGDADSALETLTSFNFVFILHLTKHIMEITDTLCQALQRKSQDILNALHLVSTTKVLIQKLRDDKWNSLFTNVRSFCEEHDIEVPNMSSQYIARRGRARHQQDEITIEHHYRIDIFNATIDSQLQELNNKFSENSMELLTLSCALDPLDKCKSFKIDDVCKLADKFYSVDFTELEKEDLRRQLRHYEVEISKNSDFQQLSTISELCQWLVKTRKLEIYPLIYRLVVLVLTLPVSTATTERAFSAMNIVKTKLRNKIEDDFLTNALVVYIEKEIAEKFSVESIIDGFRDLKSRRVPL